jgi:hypothetical protein
MKTSRKKSFDAVAESRKWREQTSTLLAPMNPREKIAFLNRRLRRFKSAARPKPVAA